MRPVTRLLAFVFLILASSTNAQSPVHYWSKRFGGPGSDLANGMAVDHENNVYIVGHFATTIDLGGGVLTSAGGNDIFMAKYNPAGAHVWSQRFGSTGNDIATSIFVDAIDRLVVTGSFNGTVSFGGANLVSVGSGDIFLARYFPTGTHIWSRQFGSVSIDEGNGVVVDANLNIYLVGLALGAVDMGGGPLPHAGNTDIVLAKYDFDGLHQWSKTFGSTLADVGTAVAVDGSNNVVFTGYFQNSIDFGGGPLTSAGTSDICLVKFNTAGTHQWSKRFGALGPEVANAVTMDSPGNVILGARFSNTVDFGGGGLISAGSTDMVVAKFNSGGTHQWSRRYGSTSLDDCLDVALDGSGNVLFSGSFNFTVGFGGDNFVSKGLSDAAIVKLNSSGVHQWSAAFGTSEADVFNDVVLDFAGNVITSGRADPHVIDLGGGELYAAGSADIMVAKFGSAAGQPQISTIADVGNDQGRQVRITFAASGGDLPGATPQVSQYEAFRRIDPLPSAERRGLLLDDWELVGSVSAHGESNYSIVVPTEADSTVANGQHLSVFFIRAATSVPHRYWDSNQASGYSVDNLAPSAPGNFIFAAGSLTWNKSKAADFDFFSVYGSSSPTFDTNAVLIGHTIDTGMNVVATPHAFYYVTATDFSGNEGAASRTNTASDVGTRKFTLAVSAYPNPFNPATTIRYDVPSRGRVVVSVLDITGAHVTTLVDEVRDAGSYPVRWDGENAEGARVSSGVYFVRLEHSSATRTRKIVLLK